MEMKRYQKEENFSPEKIAKLREHYKAILELLGEDPAREGLLKTPERVAKAMSFLTQGYEDDPLSIIRSATFKEEYRQMVLVKDIELYSLCEHHMLPFYGKAHVAYIPNGYITGLSKIARVVESFARRLQVQERLTVQIRRLHPGSSQPDGRRRRDRSQPYVYADAGRRKAGFGHDYLGIHRSIPLAPAYAPGVHDADQQQIPVK